MNASTTAPALDGRPLRTTGPVLIIGCGLIGGSIALALSHAGIAVVIEDASPVSVALASDLGAGRAPEPSDPEPALVIVAVPPDVTATCVLDALERFPHATVTDVASVKTQVISTVIARTDAASRYVSCHPMAGRERSGVGAADRDLFIGRPWVVVPHADSDAEAVLRVRDLGTDLGASTSIMSACDHDRAVALISHVPQVVASILGARLIDASDEALALAGQGLRDTTRIAASDPRLWTTILDGNRHEVATVLRDIATDLDAMVSALDGEGSSGIATMNRLIANGNRGVERIPGKHGGAPQRWATLEVLVPDRPGELAHLFADLGELGINVEDLLLDHSANQAVGAARVMVDPACVTVACRELAARGWRLVTS